MNIWPYRWIGSSSATVFGVEVFGPDWPKWHPIWPLFGAFRWLDSLKWAALHRWHPRHRYSIVRTDLAPGYYDVDTRMLHACMALLCSYIEVEHGGEEVMCGPTGQTDSAALEIYRWWKHQRPANHAKLDEWCMRLFGGKWESWVDEQGRHCCGVRTPPDKSMGSTKEYWAFERQLEADDQRMLHRLIDIRRGLWT